MKSSSCTQYIAGDYLNRNISTRLFEPLTTPHHQSFESWTQFYQYIAKKLSVDSDGKIVMYVTWNFNVLVLEYLPPSLVPSVVAE